MEGSIYSVFFLQFQHQHFSCLAKVPKRGKDRDLGAVEVRVGKMLPVLAYHYFESKGCVCPSVKTEDRVYVVKAESFDQQMDHLRSKGYVSLCLSKERSNIQNRMCVISFDDGHISCYTIAFPILINQGMSGIFFICPGMVNREGNMTWSQLRELVHAGLAVGSHSYSHVPLDSTDEKHLVFELTSSKKEIEDRLGIEVSSIALPMGYYSKRCLDAAKACGYTYVFTSRIGFNLHVKNNVYERIMIKSHHTLKDFRRMVEFSVATKLKYGIINSAHTAARKTMPVSVFSALRKALILRMMESK